MVSDVEGEIFARLVAPATDPSHRLTWQGASVPSSNDVTISPFSRTTISPSPGRTMVLNGDGYILHNGLRYEIGSGYTIEQTSDGAVIVRDLQGKSNPSHP